MREVKRNMTKLTIGKTYRIDEYKEDWRLDAIDEKTLSFTVVSGELKGQIIDSYNKQEFIKFINPQ